MKPVKTRSARRTKRPPHILLILTDDQRADTVGAWGNTIARTPAMDTLVRRGVTFDQACIMGGTNPAVCMPSRNMLMSGRGLFRIGGTAGETIPDEHATLPGCLRAAGYHTHHIGKWHQDRRSFHRSFCGADRIFAFNPGWYVQHGGHWNVAIHDFDPTGAYPVEAGYLLDADKRTRHPLIPGRGGVHSSELFSDAAVDFLRRYGQGAVGDGRQPFFLYLAYTAPHDPRQSPEAFERQYDAGALTPPPNFLERHPFDNGEFTIRDEMLEGWPRRPHAIQRHLADYYACIAHLDAQIGRVLETLRDTGLEDDTLIVFASDNGLAIGSHGLMGKQNLYEHSVRVPLVFAGPGLPAGQRCATPCYLLDVFPTLCELTGVPIPTSVEGQSLAPTLLRGAPGGRQTLYFAYRGCQRAVRNGRWKLIEYVADGRRQTQLFDLASDPFETRNLADETIHHPTVARLRQALLRQREAYGDTRPQEAAFWQGFGANETLVSNDPA